MSARFPAFVAVAFAAFSGSAQLSSPQMHVMAFDCFAQPGKGVVSLGPTVHDCGMILSTLSAEGRANDFVAWRTNDSCSRGSAAVANDHSYGTTVLSRTNGAPFDFVGLDLAGFQAFHTGTVTFYGFRGFDCVASEAFTFTNGSFQTFRSSRLTNVTEVRWNQASAATPQFDNVTVVFDASSPPAQPVIRLRHGRTVAINIAGLMVNRSYALEYAAEAERWVEERTFTSSSTINFPGFLSVAVPTNRFYRVRSL